MTKVFRVLAFIVAGLVALQAVVIAWAFFGLWKFIEDGEALDSAVMEGDESPFAEAAGFMIHGMNGMMVIPVMALVLLIIGLIAKFPGAKKFGAAIFLLVVLQVVLGIAGFSIPAVGALHGLNAMLLFGVAVMAGVRAKDVSVGTHDNRPLVDA